MLAMSGFGAARTNTIDKTDDLELSLDSCRQRSMTRRGRLAEVPVNGRGTRCQGAILKGTAGSVDRIAVSGA